MSLHPPHDGVELDHTSFAVHDAPSWARHLRSTLGATPVAGEVLPEFRYLLLWVGDAERGARLELMDGRPGGFLDRFLTRHDEGVHHLTFAVPDLAVAVARVRAAGATVVGESYEHPPWREAFIQPDARHGVVVQLAQSDRTYPSPETLLATRERDADAMPATRTGTDPGWWEGLWTTPAAQPPARLGDTHLASTDLDFSRRLFGDALGGRCREEAASLRFVWPGGSVCVHEARHAGVTAVELHGHDATVRIGSGVLRA